MSSAAASTATLTPPAISAANADFVTMTVGGQLFGIPVLQVRDVLGPQRITKVPLAPPAVAGSLNLRGRIVTAIDLRIRLNMPARAVGQPSMSVVVAFKDDLYSFIIDAIGEVVSVPLDSYERNPPTLDPVWENSAYGVYRLDNELMVALNIDSLLQIGN